MDTMLLDRSAWDLCVDATGNIARAGDFYSQVQDTASAARLFLGELYYGPPTRGVPYFTDAFGRRVPTQLLRARLVDAALAVPGVHGAQCFLSGVRGRTVTGQIHIQTAAGPAIVTI